MIPINANKKPKMEKRIKNRGSEISSLTKYSPSTKYIQYFNSNAQEAWLSQGAVVYYGSNKINK